MSARPLFIGIVIGILLTTGYLLSQKTPKATTRPTLSVGPEMGIMMKRARDIWQICPDVVFGMSADKADYEMIAHWSQGKWETHLFRWDSAYLFAEESPDFNQIMRDACKAIREDRNWIVPERPVEAKSVDLANRYQLHEVRNGGIVGTAMVDTKTGRVWIWRDELDSKGRKTGSSFSEEDVSPPPENK